MKIAQIAPLIESVPPRLYGGTERIVAYLTDELVRLGHEVTLFASGDSVSRANLVSCAPMALRLDSNVHDPIPYYMLQLDRVRRLADKFDILHFHIDQFDFPCTAPTDCKCQLCRDHPPRPSSQSAYAYLSASRRLRSLHRTHLAGEGAGSRHSDCAHARYSIENRRQGGQGGRSLLPRENCPPAQ